MGKLGLSLFVLLMCEICYSSVKLNMWFLLDFKEADEFAVLPDVIWRHLMRSKILQGQLANYTVVYGSCSLEGARKMMSNFTPNKTNEVHAFIGPACSYISDVTGLISSAYSIPQVSGSYRASSDALLSRYWGRV